ncbi:MAG: hypothetical protein ACO3LE_10035 [Bdellovibrionota bacterium]
MRSYLSGVFALFMSACGTMDYGSSEVEAKKAESAPRKEDKSPEVKKTEMTEEEKAVESYLSGEGVGAAENPERQWEIFLSSAEGLAIKSAVEAALMKKQAEARNLLMVLGFGIGGLFGLTTYFLDYHKFQRQFKENSKRALMKKVFKIGLISSSCGAALGFLGTLGPDFFSTEIKNLSEDLSLFEQGSGMSIQDVREQYQQSVLSPGEEEDSEDK